MSKLRCHISISVDGFVAGPNQSKENPLGEGGELLHGWMAPLAAWREAHGRDGSFRSSVRIVNVEDSRREREEERRAEREAKRKAEAERLARLGY